MAKLPKIAVCFPSSDMVHADFALSLAGLCTAVHPLEVVVINPKSSIVAQARNNGVARAQEAGADAILFLDSDMVFPSSILIRLLAHRKAIVGAVYTKRLPPYELLGSPVSHAGLTKEGLAEMARMPTGCLLIAMEVFEKIPKPYFRFGFDEETGHILGEDYAFCDGARMAGFRIWADMDLSREIGHIGQRICHVSDALENVNS